MQVPSALRIGVLTATLGPFIHGQNTPRKNVQAEAKGMPLRATPSDYQAHAQAGSVTIAAEFKGHSIASSQIVLITEEYVVVEAALFGAADARITLSSADFSLRINGKKPLTSVPYGLVVGSVKDPEWEPPVPPESKSKSKVSGGGKEKGEGNEPPVPVKVPIEVLRDWAQRVRKATLPEGDRPLPQAGLIYFQHRGKTQGIQSIELIYNGPPGKATLTLQP
jgi:hypothetical protein